MINLSNWLNALQINDIDLNLMETAFTHGSYRGLGHVVEDYQRLEFLGDAVINLIVSEKFFTKGDYPEGDLTELRSRLVKERPLAELFDKMEMSFLVRSVASLTESIKSDIVEAFFAVIYLGKGIKKCSEVWDIMMERTGFEEEVIKRFRNRGVENLENFTPEQIEERNVLVSYYDFLEIKFNQNVKNVLQQLFQKIYKSQILIPDYNDFTKEGPDHAPIYNVRLNETISINEKIYNLNFEGVANNKKDAEIKAAEKACDLLYLPYNRI